MKKIKTMNLMQLNNKKTITMIKIKKKKLTNHLLKKWKLKFNSSNYSNKNLEQLKKINKIENKFKQRIIKLEIQKKHVILVE